MRRQRFGWSLLFGVSLSSSASLLACSPDSDNSKNGTGGGAGLTSNGSSGGASAAGSGGASVGSGGASVGSGGASVGSGGASVGSGGATVIAGGSGGRGGSAGAGLGGDVGRGGVSGASAGGTSAGGAQDDKDAVPFKGGTRLFEHIINIVDPQAAAQLEGFFDAPQPARLELPANAFYEYYLDEYDFIFFITSRPLDTLVAARFMEVNRTAIPGTGIDSIAGEAGYRTDGRLKGVMGVQLNPNFLLPALGHEIAHYWANYLDPKLGFDPGTGNIGDPHWQFTGINGVIGGFDPTTLHCAKPEGAPLSSCTPETNGRIRYRVGLFFPNDNTARAKTYAPLELYLMGLLPASEVPESYPVLRDAEELLDTYDAASNTLLVESTGLGELTFSQIVARHGNRALAPDSERSFTAAFVLVSGTPADEQALALVSSWQEIFGNYVSNLPVSSFETLTGGRATMKTRLGRRRKTSEPVAPPSPGRVCSYVSQDCPQGYGCYRQGRPMCATQGTVEPLGACDGSSRRCTPGYDCFTSAVGAFEGTCFQYCDPVNSTSPIACQTLCPLNFQPISEGTVTYGVCL